jgi:hypothetical protein
MQIEHTDALPPCHGGVTIIATVMVVELEKLKLSDGPRSPDRRMSSS